MSALCFTRVCFLTALLATQFADASGGNSTGNLFPLGLSPGHSVAPAKVIAAKISTQKSDKLEATVASVAVPRDAKRVDPLVRHALAKRLDAFPIEVRNAVNGALELGARSGMQLVWWSEDDSNGSGQDGFLHYAVRPLEGPAKEAIVVSVATNGNKLQLKKHEESNGILGWLGASWSGYTRNYLMEVTGYNYRGGMTGTVFVSKKIDRVIPRRGREYEVRNVHVLNTSGSEEQRIEHPEAVLKGTQIIQLEGINERSVVQPAPKH